MKCVSEDDVTQHVVRAVVGYVNGGVELKIARQVTSKPGGDGVTGSALEIELCPPGLIEVAGPAENGFVARASPDRADDEFVMLGVVTYLDEWLGIDMTMGRPVDGANRKQPGFFLEQPKFCSKD